MNERLWAKDGDEFLCRSLCRNPAIPAPVGRCRVMSLHSVNTRAKVPQRGMNIAFSYHSVSLLVATLRTGQGIDTVEVRSSSLLVPTISFIASGKLLKPRSTIQRQLHCVAVDNMLTAFGRFPAAAVPQPERTESLSPSSCVRQASKIL